jgi:phosphoribulokinase
VIRRMPDDLSSDTSRAENSSKSCIILQFRSIEGLDFPYWLMMRIFNLTQVAPNAAVSLLYPEYTY